MEATASPSLHDIGDHACYLLGGAYALFLQALIGLTAMTSLLYKRAVLDEHPRRPFNIWFMDVSKQCFSSVLIHFFNIGISIFLQGSSFSGENNIGQHGDQCANYLINFIMDTLFGVFLVWILLKVSSSCAYRFDIPSLKEQGYYDNPPRWSFYIIQLLVFLIVTFISKVILGWIFVYYTYEFDEIGAFLCLPFKSSPETELTFVMAICPSILNIIQYWIQDNILMDHTGNKTQQGYDLLTEKEALIYNNYDDECK